LKGWFCRMRFRRSKGFQTTKVHYKMYKSGNKWLFATVAMLLVGLGGPVVAQADEPAVPASTVASAAAAPSSAAADSSVSTAAATVETDQATSQVTNEPSEQSVVSSAATVASQAAPVSQAEVTANQAVSEPQSASSTSAAPIKDVLPAESTAQAATTTSVAPVSAAAAPVATAPAVASKAAQPLTMRSSKLVKASQGLSTRWSSTGDGIFTLNAGTITEALDLPTELRNNMWKIVIQGPVKIVGNAGAGLFQDWERLSVVEGADQLDFSAATDINHMFANDHQLRTIDVSQWQVGQVTDFSGLFSHAESLHALAVDHWDVHSAKNMQGLFENVNHYEPNYDMTLGVQAWQVDQVTNMQDMFAGTYLASLDVSQWQVGHVTNMQDMFAQMEGVDNLDLNQWQVGNVTNMAGMFRETADLEDLAIDQWDVSHVTTMQAMFSSAMMSALDLNRWQVQNVTNMAEMFKWSAMDTLKIDQWQTHQVTTMKQMFELAEVDSLAIDHWDVSQVRDMSGMFGSMMNLKTLQLGDWDTHNVTSMAGMFIGIAGVTPLETIVLANWDTSKVTTMANLFTDQQNLKSIDVSRWQVQQVKSLKQAFMNTGLTEIDLGQWQIPADADLTRTLAAGHLSKMTINRHFRTADFDNIPTPSSEKPYSGNWYNRETGQSYTMPAMIALYSKGTGPTATYLWQPDLSTLTVQAATVAQHSPWQPGVVIAQLNGAQGEPLDPTRVASDQLEISPVDTNEVGTQQVNVVYHSATGKVLSGTAMVTVLAAANTAQLTGHDVTLIAGPKTTTAQLAPLVSGVDDQGQPLTLQNVTTEILDMNGQKVSAPDLQQVGQYWYRSSYQTAAGATLTHMSQLTVLPSKALVQLTAAKTVIGPQHAFNLDEHLLVLDAYGQPLTSTSAGVGVTWTMQKRANSPQQPGDYLVTVTYMDLAGNHYQDTTPVQLLGSQAMIETVPSLTIQRGSTFKPQQVLTAAFDANGQPLTLDQLTVTSDVDTTKLGNYTVQLSYTDAVGNPPIIRIVPVNVVQAAALQLITPPALIAGPKTTFDPTTVVAHAVDEHGQALTMAQLTIANQVNPQRPGRYSVTVSYGEQTAQVWVTVQASKAQLLVTTPINVAVGQDWQPQQAVVRATDATGQPLPWSAVTVSGQVNTQRVGTYQLWYQYTDVAGNQWRQPVTVNVVAASQPGDGQIDQPQVVPAPGDNGGQTPPAPTVPAPKPPVQPERPTLPTNKRPAKKRPQPPVQQPSPVVISTQHRPLLAAAPNQKQPVKHLPQTNERTSVMTILAGLGLLVSSLVSLSYWRRHF